MIHVFYHLVLCFLLGLPSSVGCFLLGLPEWMPVAVGGGGGLLVLLLIVVAVAVYKRRKATFRDKWVSDVRKPSTKRTIKRPVVEDAAEFVNPS